MGFGARGPTRPGRLWRHVLPSRTSWSMQSQIQPARRGGRRARSRLNRGVGGEAGRTLSGGPDTIRPRSRSDSDPSDGGGAAQRDRGRSSFRELDGSPLPDFPWAMPGPRSGYAHRQLPPGKAGGVTNGHHFHRAAGAIGPPAARPAPSEILESFRNFGRCPPVHPRRVRHRRPANQAISRGGDHGATRAAGGGSVYACFIATRRVQGKQPRNPGVHAERRRSMLLLIILLVLLFGGGGGYYGYSRWGAGGGLGIFGTVLLVVVVVYLVGGLR